MMKKNDFIRQHPAAIVDGFKQYIVLLLLPLLLKTDGIWLSNTVAEVCAFAISVIFLFAKRKKYQYF